MWKWNIRELSRFKNSFNNKKIVFIATDKNFATPEEVKEQFDKEGFKDVVFNLIPNNETLGECAAFYSMLDMVYSLKSDEYTFFAHAKGVTREVVRKKSWCSLQANKTWIKKMLAHNLISTEKINRELSKKPCFGIMKSPFEEKKLRWYFVDSKYRWIYAGGFFWFNNERLFSKDYKSIVFQKRYTIESYLSNFFTQDEAGSELSGMGDVVNFSNSPFRESSWKNWIENGYV
jgi:hypothetical protein